MTTDRLTAPEQSSLMHPSPETHVRAQLDDFSRLILECRRHTDEADLLIRQSSRMLAASESCLRKSAALIADHGPAASARRPG